MTTKPAFEDVQSLLLLTPNGPAVRHVVLQIPLAWRQYAAVRLLRMLRYPPRGASFGPRAVARGLLCSVGFSYAGLEALRLPAEYLRVFHALAPAFAAGAPARRVAVGDSAANQPPASTAWPELTPEQAHVLVSFHGDQDSASRAARQLSVLWRRSLRTRHSSPFVHVFEGEHLAPPTGQKGRWAHFGMRDDVSDVTIRPLGDTDMKDCAPDLRKHEPGELLLGHADDRNVNRLALPRAPQEVQTFFRDSSFGVFRPAMQDIAAFEHAVAGWIEQIGGLFDRPAERESIRTFVKAKLAGRWPDGQRIEPNPAQTGDGRTPHAVPAPKAAPQSDDYVIGPTQQWPEGYLYEFDSQALGCPFGSHVRRSHSSRDVAGAMRPRPLLRRSVPYGPASWGKPPDDQIERGQLGHFFCADLQSQFEDLLGNWVASTPLGFDRDDRALDPLIGPHDDAAAGFRIPMANSSTQTLRGFRSFVFPRGMMYAWYPSRSALEKLLRDDFVPPEDRGPWL